MLNAEVKDKPVPAGMYGLGDDAFPICSWLLKKHGAEAVVDGFPTAFIRMFDRLFMRARNVSERCFGVTKTRWPVLNSGRHSHRTTILLTIAAVVLHNYCCEDASYYDFDKYDFDVGTQANEGWKLTSAIATGHVQSDVSTNQSRKEGKQLRAAVRTALWNSYRNGELKYID